MDGGSEGRLAAVKRLSAPRSLKTTNVAYNGVKLKWAAPKGAKPKHYLVLRDGKRLGKTTRPSFTDAKVKPGRTYRYSVRAVDSRNRAGALSSSVRVKVPKHGVLGPPAPAPTTNAAPPIATVVPSAPAPPPLPAPSPTPAATVTPVPTPPPDQLSEAQVDRLFWRAGFGPSQDHRDQWTGRSHAELVDWLLDTPSALDETLPKPLFTDGTPIDPNATDVEMELEWIDRMQRAINPFPDRLAFFWHRHWAISREEGNIPIPWVIKYRDLLLSHADFGRYPDATFRSLAYAMTTADPAMSLYLNMNQNVRGKPNENYAREFMELFCLGPTGPDGTPNYSQDDVSGLAKAFTGWALNTNPTLADKVTPNPDYGKITFTPGRFELTAKTFLGTTIPAVTQANANGPATISTCVDTVLAHHNHAQFLIRKLWSEFIATPIPQATLDGLIATYTSSGFKLKPLLRGILIDPLIFESPAEPNLIKPPIVYLVGVLRQLGAPLKGSSMQGAMNNMQQRVYRPPNVAGWEGGMSWLNTNTVQGRWDLITRVQYLRYSSAYSGTASPPEDKPTETPEQAVERAHLLANRPWLAQGTRDSLLAYATAAPVTAANLRRQRIYTLQSLMLGGPDGQVM